LNSLRTRGELDKANFEISTLITCEDTRPTRSTDVLVEHAIFGEDLADDRAPTCGIVLTEDVLKIAGHNADNL
jgi:hypothetical protein